MADAQKKARWGMETRAKRKSFDDPEEEGLSGEDKVTRQMYIRDFKKFYDELIANEIRDKKTGQMEKQVLGKLHLFLIDFLNLTELKGKVVTYTNLIDCLPEEDDENGFKERWIYWRTLDGEPEIQDGPDGPISTMFYGRFWQGLIIKLAGDGTTKCCLLPRGHLKSSVGTQVYRLWRICRDQSERALVETSTMLLARDFISWCEQLIETNEKFRKYFGDLGPPAKRELPWNSDWFTVLSPHGYRGKEPTMRTAAVDSEKTGGHTDSITLDDVVGQKNYGTPTQRDEVIRTVEQLTAIRDPGSELTYIGTPWHQDDVHSRFIGRDSHMKDDVSFIVATVLDADETCEQPANITPLKYGKPMYGEKFTNNVIRRLRRGIQDDAFWFGQYFSQFFGASSKTFDGSWKIRYEGEPELVAEAKQLDIFIGVDTASGQNEKKLADVDYSAAVVIGQTQDRSTFYLLGGFCEKLSAEHIGKAIVELSLHWQNVVQRYGGSFKVGCEENAYTGFIHWALDMYMRLRQVEDRITVEPIKVDQRSKHERIRLLATPYSQKRIRWPAKLVVPSYRADGEPYDFLTILEQQFDKYGPAGLKHEDALDAHARAFELCPPWDHVESKAEVKSDEDSYVYEERVSGVHRYAGSGRGISGIDQWVK